VDCVSSTDFCHWRKQARCTNCPLPRQAHGATSAPVSTMQKRQASSGSDSESEPESAAAAEVALPVSEATQEGGSRGQRLAATATKHCRPLPALSLRAS
jgi:hypothetical protein